MTINIRKSEIKDKRRRLQMFLIRVQNNLIKHLRFRSSEDEWNANIKKNDLACTAISFPLPRSLTAVQKQQITARVNFSIQYLLLFRFGRHRYTAADSASVAGAAGMPEENKVFILNLQCCASSVMLFFSAQSPLSLLAHETQTWALYLYYPTFYWKPNIKHTNAYCRRPHAIKTIWQSKNCIEIL